MNLLNDSNIFVFKYILNFYCIWQMLWNLNRIKMTRKRYHKSQDELIWKNYCVVCLCFMMKLLQIKHLQCLLFLIKLQSKNETAVVSFKEDWDSAKIVNPAWAQKELGKSHTNRTRSIRYYLVNIFKCVSC